MPNKKNFDSVIDVFVQKLRSLDDYLDDATATKISHNRMVHEHALMRAVDLFENMCFDALLASMNRADVLNIGANLPKHLNISVCRYLVVRSGYFSIRGFNDYRSMVKTYLGEMHDLYRCLDGKKWRSKIDLAISVRNACAHPTSSVAAKAFYKATGLKKGVPGAYLMRVSRGLSRYDLIVDDLEGLAEEIRIALNATL